MTAAGERVISYRDAVRDAMRQELARDPDVFVMGEDIGPYGGIYKTTVGLFEEFGPTRVMDTPISEAGFVGLATGAAMTGKRPVVEIMFIDFALVAADQLLNQAAKLASVSGGQFSVPLTVRTQQGVGQGTGAQHGQCLEAVFAHVPGFAVVLPSTPADAKGLLAAAVRSDHPVIVIEHKALYATKGPVPDGDYVVPLGQAAVRREGTDITLISYSFAMKATLEAAEILERDHGLSAEVIDLRCVVPVDWQTVLASVEKTGRAVVIHEAHRRGGVGAEIAAEIGERAWPSLRSGVRRVGGLDVPVPQAASLAALWQVQAADVVAAALDASKP
jgi:pyruvate/2-oxoglutarate/acetoin dehydrogenase E1 component